MTRTILISNLTCALVCAKWALDLGYSQLRQILFLIGGLLFGPLVLLILYVYLIRQARARKEPAGRMV